MYIYTYIGPMAPQSFRAHGGLPKLAAVRPPTTPQIHLQTSPFSNKNDSSEIRHSFESECYILYLIYMYIYIYIYYGIYIIH